MQRIYQDRSDKVVEAFPEYSENFSDVQLKHIWLPKEIKVEKDKHNILVEMTEGERHGVLTVLRLFTQYEVFAGEDWWAGRFKQILKGPEFTRMASVFSMTELAIHKPFYQQLNEILGLDTDEFYISYTSDHVLKERIDFIDEMINHPDDQVALGVFSMVEGGILYSSFGFLKSYQSKGKNDIKTVVSGINYSLADEGLHSIATATAFRHLVKEKLEDGLLSQSDLQSIRLEIEKAARVIYEHEKAIIQKIFEKGGITHISKEELLAFVGARLNECLINLGFEALFSEEGDTISEWFYKNITSFVMHDFFNSLGSQYTATWLEEDFDPRQLKEDNED